MPGYIKIGIATIIGTILFVAVSGQLIGLLSFTKSTREDGGFYRLRSSYMHDNERVDFDVVVGCNVSVSVYKDNDSSFDAFRYPNVFVKATRSHGAILQMIPEACSGETTENEMVPRDLLPGAIWFDSAEDLSLGHAYITEAAFEAPNAKLRFLGATISKATKKDWEEFQPIAKQNLIKPEIFTRYFPPPSEDEVKAHLWDRSWMAKWLPDFECYGYARIPVTDGKFKQAIDRQWPLTRPRYWIPTREGNSEIWDFVAKNAVTFAGKPFNSYFHTYYDAKGFPTRRGPGGGVLSQINGVVPSPVYPLRADNGVPWVGKEMLLADRLYRDVDLSSLLPDGNLLCYSNVTDVRRIDAIVPDLRSKTFVTKIGGIPVEYPPGKALTEYPPQSLFEGDEAVFSYVVVSLT